MLWQPMLAILHVQTVNYDHSYFLDLVLQELSGKTQPIFYSLVYDTRSIIIKIDCKQQLFINFQLLLINELFLNQLAMPQYGLAITQQNGVT